MVVPPGSGAARCRSAPASGRDARDGRRARAARRASPRAPRTASTLERQAVGAERLVGLRRSAARDRPRAHRSWPAPCASRPAPRPRRTGRCSRRSPPPACRAAASRDRSRNPVERVLQLPGDRRRCTPASRRARRPRRRSPPSGPRPPGARRARRPRCTAGSPRADRRRTSCDARTAAARRAPPAGACCGSRGAGCRTVRGSPWR